MSEKNCQHSEQADFEMDLAVLIRNTRTTRRHVSLTEFAEWLGTAIAHVGSVGEVAIVRKSQ